MELYGPEGKKLRKKDKDAFYYPSGDDELVKIPSILDSEDKVKSFIKICMEFTFPDISESDLDDIWEAALKKNDIIIDALETLKRESESEGSIWKSRAYAKAVKALKSLKIPIVSGAQVMKIPGVGKGIASHIEEILKTGKLKSQEERLEGAITRQAVIEKFISIWGVGPKIASKWYEKGYRDIEDLVEEKLTEQQKVGIKYNQELKERIPREEAKIIFDIFKNSVLKMYPKAKLEIVGSYRRGAETVGDIDIIVSGKIDLEAMINKLMDIGLITDSPVLGNEKFMGIAKIPDSDIHRRIDVRLVDPEEWGAALLHSTGPDTFNIQLRQQASQLGYKLNEKGLFRLSIQDGDDELIPTKTEKDIFKELGISYVEPEKRS